MATFWQDVQFGVRSLRKGVLVSVLAVGSLALAIGGNTTVFGLVSVLLYPPLPYPHPERLVLFGEREASSPPVFTTSAANFLDWRERSRSFEGLAAFRATALSVGSGDRPEAVAAGEVTPDFFKVLGVQAARGRTFEEAEGRPGGPDVVVLSQDFAARRFDTGVDPLGRTLTLNGRACTIIGVLPADFEFLAPNLQLWVPLRLDRGSASRVQRDLFVIGRLADGVTMAQAKAEMAAIVKRLETEYPESNRGFVADVLNFRYEFPDPWRRQLYYMLVGVVLAVLLVACVNIANLLLARGQARTREIAMRAALGAGRRRIVRQLVTESLVLASFGGAVGLALGWGGIRAMAATLAPYLPRFYTPVLDLPVVLFTLGLTMASGVLFGIAPALAAFRLDLVDVLKEGGRGGASGGRRRLSRALVVAEIALSLVLLGGAAVMVRSFLDFQNADPGYDQRQLMTATLTLPATATTPAERGVLVDRLIDRVRAMRGVTDVATTTSLPQNVATATDSFIVDTMPPAPGEAHPRATWVAVSPDYARTLKVPMVRGRFIEASDRESTAPVVVVSRGLAEKYWGDADPVGEHLTFQGQSRTIVGVVGNVRQSIINFGDSGQAAIYLPFEQHTSPALVLVARTSGDAKDLLPVLRRELVDVDRQLTVGQVITMRDFVERFYVGLNLFNVILGGFGLLALLLAAVGTYGVLAYNVAQRSQEIGVRMAMGAPRGRVLAMFVKQGLTLGLIGLAVGTPGVIVIDRFVRSLLSVFSSVPALTVVAVGLVLLAATFLASLVPAWRAATLSPMQALRRG
jgi:putative ABC transport system permease protein